jgi:integrase
MVLPIMGEKVIQHLRPRDIRDFLAKRRAQESAPSKATLNRDRQFIFAVLNLAVQDELIPTNPAASVGKFKEPPGRSRWLTPEEVVKLLGLLSTSSAAWLAPIVKLAVNTGMRLSEILNPRRGDIQGSSIRLSKTKNGKTRHVPINGPAREVLEKAGALNKRVGPEGAGILIFPNADGKAYKPSSIGHAFKRAVRLAGFDTEGIDAVTFHTLRHTAVSWMVQAGIPDRQIMATVGHSSAQMVSRYAHLAPNSLTAPAMALEAMFQSGSQEQNGVLMAQDEGSKVADSKAVASLSREAS